MKFFSFVIQSLFSSKLSKITKIGRKELKIWLPRWFYGLPLLSRLMIYWLSILFFSIFLVYENFKIALLFGLFYIVVQVLNIYYSIKSDWQLKVIANINHLGFHLQTVINGKVKTDKIILWQDIRKISLKEVQMIVVLKGNFLTIPNDTVHYYTLLRHLPNYTNVTNEQVNVRFQELKPCLICGSVATYQMKCHACGTYTWQKEFSTFYPTQKAYIHAKQLDLFASLHKKGAQSLMFNRDTTFKVAKDWTLSVAESEILNYSQRRFWVL